MNRLLCHDPVGVNRPSVRIQATSGRGFPALAHLSLRFFPSWMTTVLVWFPWPWLSWSFIHIITRRANMPLGYLSACNEKKQLPWRLSRGCWAARGRCAADRLSWRPRCSRLGFPEFLALLDGPVCREGPSILFPIVVLINGVISHASYLALKFKGLIINLREAMWTS